MLPMVSKGTFSAFAIFFCPVLSCQTILFVKGDDIFSTFWTIILT